MKSRNFDGYKFSDYGNLDEAREKLGEKRRIDFLVEDGNDDLLSVCGEAIYFRYSIEVISRGTRTLLEAIEDDFEKLKLFSEYDICRNTTYAVLDNYYHMFDRKS